MANPDDALKTMISNLEKSTGKSLATWTMLCTMAGIDKHGALVKWLKTEHGMTHGYANLVAAEALRQTVSMPSEGGELLEAQYAGDKMVLKPIYDALVDHALSLGKDVEIAPKKSYTALRRSKQFALIQPSTKTRVDLGLNLKGVPPSGRLEASGSFSAMCTHRIRLESVKEVDAEVRAWLKQAYQSA